MSLFSIQNFFNKEKERDKEEKGKKKDEKNKIIPKSNDKNKAFEIKISNGEIITEDNIFKTIPKTKIQFKKNLQIEAEKAEENRRANYDMDTLETINEVENLKITANLSSNSRSDEDKIEYNKEYEEDLNQEKLTK